MSSAELLSEADRTLLEKICSGVCIMKLEDSSGKYKELVTGLLLQYADSEMAGAAGYASSLPIAPSLAERSTLARIITEKYSLAEKTYSLVAQTGINVDKYVSSHCWESRLNREVSLGYRRMSGDKRLNALMYPIQGWPDLVVFTYLMASMACMQLEDFTQCSFEPWAALAHTHLPIERSHKQFGADCLHKLAAEERSAAQIKLSLNFWHEKVMACFGPPASSRNTQFQEFRLKSSRNEELASKWQNEINSTLRTLSLI